MASLSQWTSSSSLYSWVCLQQRRRGGVFVPAQWLPAVQTCPASGRQAGMCAWMGGGSIPPGKSACNFDHSRTGLWFIIKTQIASNQLDVDGKAVAKASAKHTRTQTNGQHENIMSLARSSIVDGQMNKKYTPAIGAQYSRDITDTGPFCESAWEKLKNDRHNCNDKITNF